MKQILTVLLLFLVGCSTTQISTENKAEATPPQIKTAWEELQEKDPSTATILSVAAFQCQGKYADRKSFEDCIQKRYLEILNPDLTK